MVILSYAEDNKVTQDESGLSKIECIDSSNTLLAMLAR